MQYLNMRTSQGVETIDELDRKDFATFREFRKEGARLLNEYQLAFHGAQMYWSSRPCKNWKN